MAGPAAARGSRCRKDVSRLWRPIHMDGLRATLLSSTRLSAADMLSGVPERATRRGRKGQAMTDEALEILSVMYALGDRIAKQDWASAGLMQEWLLQLVSPPATPLHRDTAASSADARI